MRPVLGALLLASFSVPSSADLLIGKVVDSAGQPVAGVDIDIDNLRGGGDPPVSGDFTDAFGNFSVTVPAGFYDIIFVPPKPPLTTHLISVVPNVIVAGTKDLGTVTLTPGIAFSGRTVTSSGVPVSNINLDIKNASGVELLVTGDHTDAAGKFLMAAPMTEFIVEFVTTGAVWPTTLAPKAFHIAPTGATDLGDIVLPDGFVVSGFVNGPGGALQGADLDATDTVTDEKLFTPGDNTDTFGFFDFIVPAGTYDFGVCPPLGLLLAGTEIQSVTVTADTFLGTAMLNPGVVLTGTVTDSFGAPLVGVDLDAFDPSTGSGVVLCDDNTDLAGAYSVIVPSGIYNLRWEAPLSMPYGSVEQLGVAVGGTTVADAVLPDCPFFTLYGVGTAGSGGIVPHLETSGGAPRKGNPDIAYELSDGRGGSVAVLAISLASSSLPLFGGTVLIDLGQMIVTVPLVLSGAFGSPGVGAATFPFPVPIDNLLVGLTLYHQYVGIDPEAPANFSMSEGMALTFCP